MPTTIRRNGNDDTHELVWSAGLRWLFRIIATLIPISIVAVAGLFWRIAIIETRQDEYMKQFATHCVANEEAVKALTHRIERVEDVTHEVHGR